MGRLKVVGCKANCKGSDKPRPIDKRRKTIASNMYHRQGTMQHCLNKLWATSPLSQSLKRAIHYTAPKRNAAPAAPTCGGCDETHPDSLILLVKVPYRSLRVMRMVLRRTHLITRRDLHGMFTCRIRESGCVLITCSDVHGPFAWGVGVGVGGGGGGCGGVGGGGWWGGWGVGGGGGSGSVWVVGGI
jgi:hypothetical protein